MPAPLTLIIGTKRWSTWSLRPWLALAVPGIPFAEEVVALRQPETKTGIAALSPSGKVPCLRHGDLLIWDSLAICEYVAELFPDARLWPADPAARAIARSVCAEMHAGFAALRTACPMDIGTKTPMADIPADVSRDVTRITALWRDCRQRFGQSGPFLFGRFSIADAMYAPVVSRFDSYGLSTDETGRLYIKTILDLPAMRKWSAEALA